MFRLGKDMQPLTIVQCVNNLDLGGVEQLVLSLLRELRIRRFGVAVCCIENRGILADQAETAGAEILALNTAQQGKFAVLRTFTSWLKKHPPVIIHSHNFKPFYYSALATALGAASGHIHSRHGSLLQHHSALWRYRLLRRWVDTWVTVSGDRQTELAQRTGLSPSKIQVLPNGVDTTRFAPSTDKSAVRRLLGLPENILAIVVAARLAPEKDFATLLRAFAQVRSGMTEVELWFVGDGPERPALESLARDLKLTPSVRFLGQRNDVEKFLQSADLFALSSLSEGMSIALIEAAACGLPMVATAVGGNGEVVKTTDCGRLVPPSNPSAMAIALLEVLRDKPLRLQMSHAARQMALEQFGVGQMVDRYVALYEAAARRRLKHPSRHNEP
jgi:glycosyltransferase involved in cell wall biosynthesis